MKKIRKSIFETNSSSSHSIHIDADVGLMDTSLIPDESGLIEIYGGEFGWEWDRLTSAYDKVSYCFMDYGDVEMLNRVIKRPTGAKKILFVKGDGYIDHASSGTSRVAFKDDETLRNFLFNPKSILYTGNDNEEHPLNFYCDSSNGKFKISLIEESIFRELNINSVLDNLDDNEIYNNMEWVYSFTDSGDDLIDAIHEFKNNYLYDISGYINDEINIDERYVRLYSRDYNTKEMLFDKKYVILIKKNK